MSGIAGAGQRSVTSAASAKLERAAFAALVALAVIFPFEMRQPITAFGWHVLTSVEAVLALALGLWLAARIAQARPLAVPRRLWLPVLLWLAILAISALRAPAFRDEALRFTARASAGVLAGLAAYDLWLARSATHLLKMKKVRLR